MKMQALGGMSASQRYTIKYSDDWLTPPRILLHLGAPDAFDLDPSAPLDRPWDTAKKHYTIKDNGLAQEWQGRVWLNPPYGNVLGRWMRRMALHGNGIALVFARTETEWFSEYVFKAASGLLFLSGRLNFFKPDGTESKYNSGAPSVLIAYDREFPCPNARALHDKALELDGFFVRLDPMKDGSRRL